MNRKRMNVGNDVIDVSRGILVCMKIKYDVHVR